MTKQTPPTSPGEMLKLDYMPDMGLKVPTLAKHLGVGRSTLQALIDGGRCSAEMAVRLGNVFDTSSEYWMNLQGKRDLWEAKRAVDTNTTIPLAGAA